MGKWEPISDALYATQIHHCDLCGKMMVKRFWQVEYSDKSLSFCAPRCETTFFNYWLPRYGAEHGFIGADEKEEE